MRIIVKLIVLSFCIYSVNNVHAQEFNHLRLKNNFKASSLKNILDELQELLKDDFESIGHERVGDIIDNHDLGGGVLNYNGFDWYKPMLNYNVYARRDVAPELFSDRWIVHDQFTISIDAATLLTNLAEGDIIEISDEALELFTGLSFTRSYEYFHFADSYLDGISSDFSKLFLSFNIFNTENLTSLKDENIFKKSDQFNFYIGGNANIPISNALAIRASGNYELSFQNTLTLQHIKEESVERYRLSGKSQKNTKASLKLSVQQDFFNLLQLTLLSFEVKYEMEKSNELHLSLSQEQLEQEQSSEAFQQELNQFFKGSHTLDLLRSYLISSEQRKLENYSSKLSFLLLGATKSSSLEEVQIAKDGIIKSFFKSISSSQYYIQSLASKISSFLTKLLGLETQTKKRAVITKSLEVEFEKHSPLQNILESEKDFSLKFTQDFKTSDIKLKLLKEKTLFYLGATTPKYIELSPLIEQERLIPPFHIQSSMLIHEAGLLHFNSLKTETKIIFIAKTCDIKNFQLSDVKSLIRRSNGPRNQTKETSTKRCFRNLYKTFMKYNDQLNERGNIDINQFKKFIGSLYSKTKSFNELTPLFGNQNVFIHGQIQANTIEKKPFISYFSLGEFKGLGLIENYRNQ